MSRHSWTDHERWLGRVLGPLDDGPSPALMMVGFVGDEATWLVDGRHERPGERRDPITELAVVAAELGVAGPVAGGVDAAVIAMPGRLRDLDASDRPVIARLWVLTSARWRPGGGVELRARFLPGTADGHVSDLEVDRSPVARVLDDAIRHPLGVRPLHALYAAARWDHRLLTTDDAATAGALDPLAAVADPGSPDATPARDPGSVAAANRACERLDRHARDLAARHRPTAPADPRRNQPAVHADVPDGWQPACPV